MATEQLMERKTFTVRGRARAPLFASMTQGMTVADLKRSPMPVLGEVSGKKVAEKPKLTFGEVMKKSRDRAFRGGIAGFAAGVVQVSLRPRLAPRPNDPRFKPALDRISTNEPRSIADRLTLFFRRVGRLLHVASHHHELPVRERRLPR